MTENPAEGEQTPAEAPMTRREARRLREAEEAARRGGGPSTQRQPQASPPAADGAAAAPAGPSPAASGPLEPVSDPAPGAPVEEPAEEAAPDSAVPDSAESPEESREESRDEAAEEAPSEGDPHESRDPAPDRVAPAHSAGVPAPIPAPAHSAGLPAPGAMPVGAASATRAASPVPPRPAAPPAPRAAEPAQRSTATPSPGRAEPPSVPEGPAGFIRTGPTGPPTGFRGFLYRITGGALNLGPSEQERRDELLEKQISRRLDGNWNTAFLSLKGGIGKTSTTVGVGLTLAELRPEPPCAIDANPDAGDLVERALGEGSYESERRHSITSLLRDFGAVTRRSELVKYLHQAGSLHLLAGEQDPELSDSLTAEDYRKVHGLVARHFAVTLTDCGTGVSRPAMRGILEDADNIVVVAGYAVSGAKRARDTLRWLSAHGYDRLAQSAIVVVTDKDGVSARVDKAAIEATLAGLCRALIVVPHDRSMADGDLVSLGTLRPETRRAYREIAAAIVSGYER